MPPVVVIDACVLYSAALRDILLRLAEIGLVSPRWSERILDETARALCRTRPDLQSGQVQHLIECMSRAFPESMIDPAVSLTLGLPDANDEHVLAVATACSADLLLTFNVRDFPMGVVQRVTTTQVATPDELLLALLSEHPNAVHLVLAATAADLRNPPVTTEQLLDGLHRQAPRFVEEYRRRGGPSPVVT